MTINLKILNVVPTNNWKLIFRLSDEQYRILDYKDLGEKYRFLAYPNQLNAFTFCSDEVEWKNGAILSLPAIISNSKIVEIIDIQNEGLYLGQKNQAPTDKHEKHHVFYVTLYPFSEQPIIIGESIGGGHGESGGCSSLTIERLKGIKTWKEHFKKADCDWAIDLIDNQNFSVSEIIFELIKVIRESSEFNK